MRALLFTLCVAAFATTLAAAPRPDIENLAATAARGKVSVKFTLRAAFSNSEMVEALKSGLPTTFTYVVEVFRDRPNWFDDTLDRARIEVSCTFNSITREYLLSYRRDRHLVRSESFTDLAALQQRMTTVDEPDLFDVDGYKPYKLKVRAKADLMRGWLFYVIPWDVTTRWREARVKAAE
ncbi:MAG: DUF4390 domain-containing protein [Acidobacteria bacterium]|nr:DUF4390 domain-containing protein [Acidobacteriota bacterium]MBV9478336.1 DUF4390 domain-containing protein [Acidobacteriota bacterium]